MRFMVILLLMEFAAGRPVCRRRSRVAVDVTSAACDWSSGLTSARALADVPGELRGDRRQVPLQLRIARVRRERVLVHVQRAIELDLQTVAPLVRASVLAHDLHALVRIVDRDGVAQHPRHPRHERGEFGLARRSVAIAEYYIRALA